MIGTFSVMCAVVMLAQANGLQCPEPVALHEYPLVVTYYNPALGGINCDIDCRYFADGTEVNEQSYGVVAACPPEWLGWTIQIESIGDFLCRDTGGLIGLRWSEYYQTYVVYVDLMLREQPDFNYNLIAPSSYQVTWQRNRAMSNRKGALAWYGNLNLVRTEVVPKVIQVTQVPSGMAVTSSGNWLQGNLDSYYQEGATRAWGDILNTHPSLRPRLINNAENVAMTLHMVFHGDAPCILAVSYDKSSDAVYAAWAQRLEGDNPSGLHTHPNQSPMAGDLLTFTVYAEPYV